MHQTTIQLCVQDESRLYHPLDPSREKLNEEVYTYLKSFCIEGINSASQFDKIQIISDVPIDGNRFREKLHRAVKRDQDILNWQLYAAYRPIYDSSAEKPFPTRVRRQE